MRFKCLGCGHEWEGDRGVEQRCSQCRSRQVVDRSDVERAKVWVLAYVTWWLGEKPGRATLKSILTFLPDFRRDFLRNPLPRLVPSALAFNGVMSQARDRGTKLNAWRMMLEAAGFTEEEATQLATAIVE